MKVETRQQILNVLREAGPATVAELAERVGVAAATVRHHLTSLRADGLIDLDLQRRTVGRPVHVFRLTEQANGSHKQPGDSII